MERLERKQKELTRLAELEKEEWVLARTQSNQKQALSLNPEPGSTGQIEKRCTLEGSPSGERESIGRPPIAKRDPGKSDGQGRSSMLKEEGGSNKHSGVGRPEIQKSTGELVRTHAMTGMQNSTRAPGNSSKCMEGHGGRGAPRAGRFSRRPSDEPRAGPEEGRYRAGGKWQQGHPSRVTPHMGPRPAPSQGPPSRSTSIRLPTPPSL